MQTTIKNKIKQFPELLKIFVLCHNLEIFRTLNYAGSETSVVKIFSPSGNSNL